MLMAHSGFVCICPTKSVELGSDAKLHRADRQNELHAELEFDAPKAPCSTYAYHQGGGVRALNPNSSMTMAETENCIAVFKGNLSNRELLAASLMMGGGTIKEADLLIRMYDAHSLDMLGRLDGSFAFCLYDSKQARVLAARDPSGAVPLVEGRTAKGSLIIACGTFMPEGVEDVTDIGPGQYKYGWHALPRDYVSGVAKQPSVRASLDHGIRRRSIDAYRAPVRQSLDGCLPRYQAPSTRRASCDGGGGSTHANSSSSHHTNRRRSLDVRAPTTPQPSSRPAAAASPAAVTAAAAAATAAMDSSLHAPRGKQAVAANGPHHPEQHHKQQQHHGQPQPLQHRQQHQQYHGPQQAMWRPKHATEPVAHAPAGAAGASKAAPAAAAANDKLTVAKPADCDGHHAGAPATPAAAATAPSSSKPNRRRHRRGRGGKGAAAAAAAAGGGAGADAHSDTESTNSNSTTSSGAPEQASSSKKAAASGATAAAKCAPAGAAAAPVMGFKRSGSCGDLMAAPAGAASSFNPATPMHGLAC